MKYVIPVILGLMAMGCATPKGATFAEQRDYVTKMHDDTLAELFSRDPVFKEKLDRSAGHGVFSNIGTNLILVTTEGGFGVVVDKETGTKTYMRMAGGGLGIGMGAKDCRLVFIFRSKSDVSRFIAGQWTVGADADAAAKAGDQGGEASGTVKTGGAEIYTLTKNGIALSATVGGTRFYRDDYLNEPATETASANEP
jgi:lipid-binding SYLF domain-containing protein